MRRPVAIILAATSLAACSVIGAPATATPVPATPAPAPTPTPTPTIEPTPAANAEALAACSALRDDVPSTQLNSGVASVAGAYGVTGDQLGNYFDRLNEVGPSDPGRSTFHDKGRKRLTMCLFDGDFTSMTPGPPGHDTLVPRVLIVIDDGQADLWAIAPDEPGQLPAIDPASIEL